MNINLVANTRYVIGLIPYSWAPLILFNFPYTLDSLPQYLPFANGAGGVGIFLTFVFQWFFPNGST